MKKIHIIGLLVIAIAIAVILVSLKNTSTYADFAEAAGNPDKEYHVVGKLDKSREQVYTPQINPDEFRFSMVDNKGNSREVVLHKSKPQDFDKSEQIVLIGKMEGQTFHANDILMKCPSKYNDSKAQLN
ncbi:MAG TPA: cytochrome c maturation protein CcmE [Bacteroidia bacterium]|nr:cytochrome c maturation protein CcmE [Bacteroidia bacterium]